MCHVECGSGACYLPRLSSLVLMHPFGFCAIKGRTQCSANQNEYRKIYAPDWLLVRHALDSKWRGRGEAPPILPPLLMNQNYGPHAIIQFQKLVAITPQYFLPLALEERCY